MGTFYNVERLKEDADCRTVARFIGMRVSGRYCECVSGLHSESQLNHCAIYKNGTHCFSCGESKNVFGMVSAYYQNVLGTPIPYTEVLKIVGDACGGAELYAENSTTGAPVARIPFEREELALLKLDTPMTGTDAHGISMQSLYFENKELFLEVVRSKAKEELEHLDTLRNALGKSAFEAKLKAVIDERYSEITRLYQKAGGREKRPVRKMFKL